MLLSVTRQSCIWLYTGPHDICKCHWHTHAYIYTIYKNIFEWWNRLEYRIRICMWLLKYSTNTTTTVAWICEFSLCGLFTFLHVFWRVWKCIKSKIARILPIYDQIMNIDTRMANGQMLICLWWFLCVSCGHIFCSCCSIWPGESQNGWGFCESTYK